MTRNEYIEQITADAIEAAKDYDLSQADDRDELIELLNDELFTDDSVTGNGSGSYTFNADQAARNVFSDSEGRDLLVQACREFCVEDMGEYILDPEAADVTIRCYLLPDCLDDVADALEDSGEWKPCEE